MKRENQTQILRKAFLSGEALNRENALEKYNVRALGKIIQFLREEGYDFNKKYVLSSKEEGKTVCQYSLKGLPYA